MGGIIKTGQHKYRRQSFKNRGIVFVAEGGEK